MLPKQETAALTSADAKAGVRIDHKAQGIGLSFRAKGKYGFMPVTSRPA
jgi:hypothetical protein